MIVLPIVIAEGWDLKLYSSQEDAELDLEPVDVEAGLYIGYDSQGRLLKLETRDSAVVLSAAESSPTHQTQLEELLRGALQRTGHNLQGTDSLESLVEAAQAFSFKPPRSNREVFKKLFKG